MKLAAIDIGSNAVRLYIARPLHEDLEGTDFKSVEFTRLPLRLGDDVFKNREISRRKADLLTKATQIYEQNFKTIPLLLVATIWYVVLVAAATLVQHALERRFSTAPGTPKTPAKVTETTELDTIPALQEQRL